MANGRQVTQVKQVRALLAASLLCDSRAGYMDDQRGRSHAALGGATKSESFKWATGAAIRKFIYIPTFCVAVGSQNAQVNGAGTFQTLIEVWTGGAWTVTTSPNEGTASSLQSVDCLSTSDCVAVGYFYTDAVSGQTLIEQWDGTQWSIVPSPNSGTNENILSGARASRRRLRAFARPSVMPTTEPSGKHLHCHRLLEVRGPSKRLGTREHQPMGSSQYRAARSEGVTLSGPTTTILELDGH